MAVYLFHRVHAGGELVKDKAGEAKKAKSQRSLCSVKTSFYLGT